jgi:hypothetical protein
MRQRSCPKSPQGKAARLRQVERSITETSARTVLYRKPLRSGLAGTGIDDDLAARDCYLYSYTDITRV